MDRLLSELDDLNGLMRTTDSAIAAAALEYIASLGELSPGSAAANMAQIVSGISDKASLDSAIDSKENEIDDQVPKIKSADTVRGTALSNLRTYITNTYNSNGTPSDDLELQDPIHTPLIRKFTCRGNCSDTFDSPITATIAHLVLCAKNHDDPPHTVLYYDCPKVDTDNTCPVANKHWVKCRKCDKLCPPPRLVVVDQSIFGMDGAIEYRDHEITCEKDAKKLVGWGPCNRTYLTCQRLVCPNDGNHKVAGACGKSGHYEKKGDANAIAKHAKIDLQCPIKHTYSSGTEVQCQIVYVYQCDPSHDPNHNFPTVITNALNNMDIAPSPTSIPTPSSDITYDCGNHSGPSSEASEHEWGTAPCGDDTHVGYLCQFDQDHSNLQASCPVTNAMEIPARSQPFFIVRIIRTSIRPAVPMGILTTRRIQRIITITGRARVGGAAKRGRNVLVMPQPVRSRRSEHVGQ